jgi:hypothetical protein
MRATGLTATQRTFLKVCTSRLSQESPAGSALSSPCDRSGSLLQVRTKLVEVLVELLGCLRYVHVTPPHHCTTGASGATGLSGMWNHSMITPFPGITEASLPPPGLGGIGSDGPTATWTREPANAVSDDAIYPAFASSRRGWVKFMGIGRFSRCLTISHIAGGILRRDCGELCAERESHGRLSWRSGAPAFGSP